MVGWLRLPSRARLASFLLAGALGGAAFVASVIAPTGERAPTLDPASVGRSAPAATDAGAVPTAPVGAASLGQSAAPPGAPRPAATPPPHAGAGGAPQPPVPVAAAAPLDPTGLRFSLSRDLEHLPAEATSEIAQARLQLRNGEVAAAAERFGALLGSPDPAVRAVARLGQAEALLADGQYGPARDLLAEHLRERSDDARAAFFLGRAHHRAGDCPSAEPWYRRHLELDPTAAPYIRLLLADCALQDGDPGRALAETDAALAAAGSGALAGPRRLAIEALERRATAHERLGDLAAALADEQRLLDLATTRSYRAERLWRLAELNRALGQTAAAADRYRALVVELPESAQARAALAALEELGAGGTVSLFQAGLVHFHAQRYAAAAGAFQAYLDLDGGPDSAAARYYCAWARLRLGEDAAAAADFQDLADRHPEAALAPEALFRSARALEGLGWTEAAIARYGRLAERYPTHARAYEGRYRSGLLRFRAGDLEAAASIWRDLAAGAPAAERARALLWLGKAQAQLGDPAAAAESWQQAVAAQPEGYYGLRARALLDGEPATASAAPLEPDALPPNEADDRDLQAWLAERGQTLEALAADLAADPSFQRGDLLLRLGLRREARWEFDDLADRSARDPARLVVLADALRDRGLHDAAWRAASFAVNALGGAVLAAPAALRKLAYPIPYPSAFLAAADERGLDPRLFAALIMQESRFDPNALSVAKAAGLTQVIPATGQGIARRLGRADFQPDHLFRPAVSLEFGAFYLVGQLQRFGGAIVPALAAYNGGPANADRWLRAAGTDDPDLFAEVIDFTETAHYVQIVWRNYALYRLIY